MTSRLNEPSLSENERKRISQIILDMTKRRAYRRCLATGQCKGIVVGGHVVPRAWLKEICDGEGNVRVFSELPVNPFKSLSGKTRCFPALEHFNNALVGSFTCQKHEGLFSSIDHAEPDLRDSRNLNLMVYRPIISTLWKQQLLLQAAQAALTEVPESELFQSMARLQRQRVNGLEYYRRQTERCLSPRECRKCTGGKCKSIGHKVYRLSGEPAVAASDFSDGIIPICCDCAANNIPQCSHPSFPRKRESIRPPSENTAASHKKGIRTRVNFGFRTVENLVNWGITVLPFSKGHKVILHHFVEEEDIIEPMSQRLSGLQGKKLQREISHQLLKSFENIAIGPRRWDQLGNRRRRAILNVFTNELPDIGFGSIDAVMKWERDRGRPETPIPNPNQINLFNPKKR